MPAHPERLLHGVVHVGHVEAQERGVPVVNEDERLAKRHGRLESETISTNNKHKNGLQRKILLLRNKSRDKEREVGVTAKGALLAGVARAGVRTEGRKRANSAVDGSVLS